MLFLLSTLALAAPVLTVSGDCPGEVHLDIIGLAYGSTAAVIVGPEHGADVLIGGRCGGLLTGLETPMLVTSVRDTDPDGRLLLRPVISNPAVCERVVQIIDADDCSVSEAHRLGDAGGGTFRGYADWAQDVAIQSDAEQDAAMNTACSTAWPGSTAATVEQLSSGAIDGLPETNDSGYWLVGRCPECEGNADPSSVEGHCRNCVDPGVDFPSDLPPLGWHTNCCTNTRSTVCID